MDGKLVLPLILELDQNDDYQLRIHHSIFNIKPESPYDPFLAMVPHTIATTIYGNVNEPRSFRARNYTLNYFRYLSNLISSDCRKTKQSGFTLLARSQFNRQSICLGLTVVTVNQFWEYSEHHSSGIYPNRDISKRGMRRVHQNAAKQIHDEFYCKPIEKMTCTESWRMYFLVQKLRRQKQACMHKAHFPLIFSNGTPHLRERSSFSRLASSNLLNLAGLII